MSYPFNNFHEMLQAAAQKYPQSVAIFDGARRTSFYELTGKVERAAAMFERADVGYKSRVALVLPNCEEFAVALLAATALGAVAVPINPSLKSGELDYILGDCEPAVAVVGGEFLGEFAAAPNAAKIPRVFVVTAAPAGDFAQFLAGALGEKFGESGGGFGANFGEVNGGVGNDGGDFCAAAGANSNLAAASANSNLAQDSAQDSRPVIAPLNEYEGATTQNGTNVGGNTNTNSNLAQNKNQNPAQNGENPAQNNKNAAQISAQNTGKNAINADFNPYSIYNSNSNLTKNSAPHAPFASPTTQTTAQTTTPNPAPNSNLAQSPVQNPAQNPASHPRQPKFCAQNCADFCELGALPRPRDFRSPAGLNDTCVILYTSGTTGYPKGAQLSYKNIFANLLAATERIGVTHRDRFIIYLPMFHSFTLTIMLLLPFFRGCGVVILRGIFPFANVLRETLRRRVSVFLGVPQVFMALARARIPWYFRAFNAIRYFISGGASLPAQTIAAFKAAFPKAVLLEGYGLSECAPLVSVNPPTKQKPGSVGTAVAGVEVKVVDDEMVELPVGSVGEIIVRGDNVMQGYLGNREATTNAIINGWLRTGDLGRMDHEGFIYIIDRIKDVIISKGENIYPREIEEVLARVAGVACCAVVGRVGADGDEEAVAFVQVDDGVVVGAGANVGAAGGVAGANSGAADTDENSNLANTAGANSVIASEQRTPSVFNAASAQSVAIQNGANSNFAGATGAAGAASAGGAEIKPNSNLANANAKINPAQNAANSNLAGAAEKTNAAKTAVQITLTPEQIRAFLREHLAAFKIPKTIYFVKELPKNATGKVLKRVLKEQLKRQNF